MTGPKYLAKYDDGHIAISQTDRMKTRLSRFSRSVIRSTFPDRVLSWSVVPEQLIEPIISKTLIAADSQPFTILD